MDSPWKISFIPALALSDRCSSAMAAIVAWAFLFQAPEERHRQIQADISIILFIGALFCNPVEYGGETIAGVAYQSRYQLAMVAGMHLDVLVR